MGLLALKIPWPKLYLALISPLDNYYCAGGSQQDVKSHIHGWSEDYVL